MQLKIKNVFIIVVFIFPILASADWKLLLRADQHHPYRLPRNTLMPNMDVACSDDAFAVRYWQVDDQTYSGVKLISLNGNEYSSPLYDESYFTSDPQIFENRKVLFGVNSLVQAFGLFIGEATGTHAIDLSEDLKNSRALTSPVWWGDQFLVRQMRKDNSYALWHGTKKLLSMSEEDIQLIHLPQVRNHQMVILVKRKVNESVGQQILSYSEFSNKVVVEDHNLNSKSPFLSFDASPQPMGNGDILFFAQHQSLGRSLWVKKQNGDLKMMAREEAKGPVSKLEYFAPQGNAHGEVLFRGHMANGKRAIWYKKSQGQPMPILLQGDTLQLNDRIGRVISREGWPAFSGCPCLSNNGNVFIHVVLEDLDGYENLGSGIFLLQ
ncbi:MAG: hypothetical protein KDD34_04470 [Bdellovibrionales bacterium]|nr:hypothetical protein [Bdellovibrionales bacterium]